MATTGPDSISGWKNISGYDIYDDKNKKKRQNQLAQNALQKAPSAPSVTDNTVNKSSGGTKAPAVVQGGRTTSNKMAGVFDNIKLPYEDTVAQKNAQKAADLKHQQEKIQCRKAGAEAGGRSQSGAGKVCP